MSLLRATLLGTLLVPASALAAGPATAPPRLQAVHITTGIVVDGRLDEAAWATAPVATDFVQNEPHPDEPASEKTEVRVLYDRDSLYVGVRARDSEPDRLSVSDLKEDFTHNTDFSQVEADNQQINLTRFNLKFPEKREFFLENAGMFQFSGGADEGPRVAIPPDDMLFFHSRQIGLTPDVSATPGVPLPILGGTRLIGRAGAFELGMLNIQQRAGRGTPGTNFTVARVRRNVLKTSDVGLIINNTEELGSGRFNLIHRPLSDLFLVYNERSDSRPGIPADRAAIAKLTYMIVR